MKTIFDTQTPRCQFEKFMMKVQTIVFKLGLIFFASIAVRLILSF